MAITAIHLAFHYRMSVCEVKLSAFVQMAIEADFRRFSGI
jgi:hypothetical protein